MQKFLTLVSLKELKVAGLELMAWSARFQGITYVIKIAARLWMAVDASTLHKFST